MYFFDYNMCHVVYMNQKAGVTCDFNVFSKLKV